MKLLFHFNFLWDFAWSGCHSILIILGPSLRVKGVRVYFKNALKVLKVHFELRVISICKSCGFSIGKMVKRRWFWCVARHNWFDEWLLTRACEFTTLSAISQLRTKEVMMAPISKRGEPLSDRESLICQVQITNSGLRKHPKSTG